MMTCSSRSNLHFHGLHVSPEAPQDDVLTMSAAPGETLRYTVNVPRNQPPGLYWYHTHQHMESYRQDLDGMSGVIVMEDIDRFRSFGTWRSGSRFPRGDLNLRPKDAIDGKHALRQFRGGPASMCIAGPEQRQRV